MASNHQHLHLCVTLCFLLWLIWNIGTWSPLSKGSVNAPTDVTVNPAPMTPWWLSQHFLPSPLFYRQCCWIRPHYVIPRSPPNPYTYSYTHTVRVNTGGPSPTTTCPSWRKHCVGLEKTELLTNQPNKSISLYILCFSWLAWLLSDVACGQSPVICLYVEWFKGLVKIPD